MTQFSTYYGNNENSPPTVESYTIDHWSPPSSPSGASPSSSPPSSNGDLRYQQGRNRIGSDTIAPYKSNLLVSTSAPGRHFNMAKQSSRNGYYHHAASGHNPHQTFMEQVRALGPFQPGMKEVPIWLKSLRLHKYTAMFQPMSYDEMMELDEATLEARQVTKGARKKILQSVAKLRERVPSLKQLEKTIDENGDPRCLIVELRALMNTPIAKFFMENTGELSTERFQAKLDAFSLPPNQVHEENLPGHIVRVLYRLHHHLFANSNPRLDLEDEYILKLIQTYDKILNSDSFTSNQKTHVSTFKRLLRRVAIDRDILPYNTERRHTFSSNYGAKPQRPRRKSMNSFSGPTGKHSPPMSSSPTPPPSGYYSGRRQSFTYNKYSPPPSQQISPKSDQSGGAHSRPAPWYRPLQQNASPRHSPPHTPPGFNVMGQQIFTKGMPPSPAQSPTSQQNNQGFNYPVPNQPPLNQFYQPYQQPEAANLQAIVSALSNPQVLEMIKNLSTKPPSQQESQHREMVSQGIQAGTPEIHMDPPNYTPNQRIATTSAEELHFQSIINDVLASPLPEEGSKLPALSQLHQRTGPQATFKPIQQPQPIKPHQNQWWNQMSAGIAQNSNAGPSLVIPPVEYRDFVNKLWEPLPTTPTSYNPMTPQIDSKPLFSRSSSIQYRPPQPPIGTGANRHNSNHQHSSPSPNPPPFDLTSLLMTSPLRM